MRSILLPLVLFASQIWASAPAREDGPLAQRSNRMSQSSPFKIKTSKASRSANTRVAAIYGEESRIYAQNIYPFTAIGILLLKGNGGNGHCTGTLVSRCHVLTVAHCRNFEGNEPYAFSSNDNNHAAHVVHSFIRKGPSFIEDESLDFQFITLSRSLGDQLGWMGIADVSNQELQIGWLDYFLNRDERTFTAAGYSSDIDPLNLTIDQSADVLSSLFPADTISLRADTFSGASGGPLFYYNEKNEPMIVGIISTGRVASYRGIQFNPHMSDTEHYKVGKAIPSRIWYAELQKYMAANPCPEMVK